MKKDKTGTSIDSIILKIIDYTITILFFATMMLIIRFSGIYWTLPEYVHIASFMMGFASLIVFYFVTSFIHDAIKKVKRRMKQREKNIRRGKKLWSLQRKRSDKNAKIQCRA